jgi:hypothetical protein
LTNKSGNFLLNVNIVNFKIGDEKAHPERGLAPVTGSEEGNCRPLPAGLAE